MNDAFHNAFWRSAIAILCDADNRRYVPKLMSAITIADILAKTKDLPQEEGPQKQ